MTKSTVRHRWLIFLILSTWEVEIRRTVARVQARKIVCENPISKTTRAKWTGVVTQMGVLESFSRLKPVFSSSSTVLDDDDDDDNNINSI
jgi:hypothetical protein